MPCILFCLLLTACSNEQQSADEPIADTPRPVWQWEEMDSPTTSHIRGLCAVDDSTIWISGSGGAVYLTTNAGRYWDNLTIPGAEELDFRDVHAEDAENAWVISAGNGVKIYATHDAGISWEEQYVDENPEVFFDGFAFWNEKEALAYGDPINGKMALLRTKNGLYWKDATHGMPEALDGEAGFAASGTGICIHNEHVWIGTGGGAQTRVLHSADRGETWEAIDTPMRAGEGFGIYGMAFLDEQYGIVVGGSYVDSLNTLGNCAYTIDGGTTWAVPDSVPRGYRSCVTFSESGKYAICVGRSGCEYSTDKGITWEAFSDEGYWVCDIGGSTLWGSGRSGKLGRIVGVD